MWNWENGIANNDYYSRYIVSYRKACKEVGVPFYPMMFKRWLKELGLKEDDISNIATMATNGKLEYQEHAIRFLTTEFGEG